MTDQLAFAPMTPYESSATFSSDRRYRYALTRRWDRGSPLIFPRRPMIVIGLNPSTADEHIDDPTIRRCINFAHRENCGALIMLNLFGLRATDPAALYDAGDPVGPENDAIITAVLKSELLAVVVAAWGAHAERVNPTRARYVAQAIPRLMCFGTTMYGQPRHPLYLKSDTPLEPYRVR